MSEGLLIVLSGPSGVGKGTVCQSLLKRNPLLQISISMTTRPPRAGEVEGVNYYFTSSLLFQEWIRQDKFLEWAFVYGNYYGTPRDSVEKKLQDGKTVILEIDTQGARQIRRKFAKGVFIFLAPPNLKELEKRILGRGTEQLKIVKMRLQEAFKEIELIKEYDYIVLNEDLSKAVCCVEAIISAEQSRVERNQQFIKRLLSS